MPPTDATILSVSALSSQITARLDKEFPNVWVSGEISNFVRASSGHMYFNLKDSQSLVKCAFFRGSNLRLRFDPRDGMDVFARGRVSFYNAKGDVQFYIEELQPKGIGAAELALRQLKEKLRDRGYFDPKRKRPLVNFPRRVALIASATGAAIRDMLELFAQRWPLTEIVVRHCRVQGEGAAEEVAKSIRMLNWLHKNRKLGFHAIVIGRGGGSSEDLSAFNEEVVADAIFQSLVPVVSAIGHEVDVTIADLVADARAETPSAAVVKLTPNRKELSGEMLAIGERLSEAIDRRIAMAKRQLDQLASRPTFRRPLDRIRDQERKLDDRSARLTRAITARVRRASDNVAGIAARLETLSPLNVLQRGYSLTHGAETRKLIRNAAEVSPGDVIVTRVASGEIVSRVEETRE